MQKSQLQKYQSRMRKPYDLPAEISVGPSFLGTWEPKASRPLKSLRRRSCESFLDSQVLTRPGARVLCVLKPGTLYEGVAGLLAAGQLAVVVVRSRGTANILIEPLDLNRKKRSDMIQEYWITVLYLGFGEHFWTLKNFLLVNSINYTAPAP